MPITINLDPDELVVGSNGLVLVAPEGTAWPTEIADVIPDPDTGEVDLATGWVDLGYLTEAGPRFSFARTTQDINAWQSFYALRTLVTEVPTQAEFDLRQWNSDTFGVAMGGIVVTTAGAGVQIEPEDPSFLDVRQLIIYGADGDKHYAFCFRRVQNTKELAFPFARSDESALPVGMKVLAPPVGEAKNWFALTDDPSFPAGS